MVANWRWDEAAARAKDDTPAGTWADACGGTTELGGEAGLERVAAQLGRGGVRVTISSSEHLPVGVHSYYLPKHHFVTFDCIKLSTRKMKFI